MATIKEFSDTIAVLISEPDDGLYDAMNKGLRHSSGDFVIFMNVGDSFLERDTLGRMYQFIGANPEFDYYYGDLIALEHGGRRVQRMPRSFGKFYMYERTICHQTILARRKLFERVGNFDLSYRLLSDKNWLLCAMSSGTRGAHTGFTVCEWEIGGACEDLQTVNRELSRIRKTHFSWLERVVFGFCWIVLKIIHRLRTRNFAVPVAWQHSKVR